MEEIIRKATLTLLVGAGIHALASNFIVQGKIEKAYYEPKKIKQGDRANLYVTVRNGFFWWFPWNSPYLGFSLRNKKTGEIIDLFFVKLPPALPLQKLNLQFTHPTVKSEFITKTLESGTYDLIVALWRDMEDGVKIGETNGLIIYKAGVGKLKGQIDRLEIPEALIVQ